ncbi:MAG: Sensor protein, partial [uncultured bacterium]
MLGSLYFLKSVEDYRTTNYLEKIAKKITTLVYDRVNFDNYGELTDIIYDFGKTYDVMVKVVSPNGSVVASYPSVMNMMNSQVKTEKTYVTSILLNDESVLGTISISLPTYSDSIIFSITSVSIILLIMVIFLIQLWSLSSVKSLVSEISKLSNYDNISSGAYKFLETQSIHHKLLDKVEDVKKYERNCAMVKTAAQVAHDIRSPLAALSAMTQDIQGVDEERRIVIRNAVQRIQDIANDLASKKVGTEKSDTEEKEAYTEVLLSGVIESLISEKRSQYRSQLDIKIESGLNKDSYGLFAKIKAGELKRVLSNIINNSIEAMGDGGSVVVRMGHEGRKDEGTMDEGRLSSLRKQGS